MIDISSVSKEHVLSAAKKLGAADPAVLERTIHAFILLERLSLSDVVFLFKGGTSLLLQLATPRRVSVDIDIICTETQERFEHRLKEWVRYPPFTRWERDVRESDNEPPTRRHYKLFYRSCFGGIAEPYVLLDVVEEECGIAQKHIQQRAVKCSFLKLKGSPSRVNVPTVDALLGDKLTAFAPNTAGVHYVNPRRGTDSAHQVIKQVFDVGQLFDVMTDYETVRETYLSVLSKEAKYRQIKNSPKVVLEDTIRSAFDLCTFNVRRTPLDAAYVSQMSDGVKKMEFDLINGSRFRLLDAQSAASKAAYLAALILSGKEGVHCFAGTQEQLEFVRGNSYKSPLAILDQLKIVPAAYWYWTRVIGTGVDLVRMAIRR